MTFHHPLCVTVMLHYPIEKKKGKTFPAVTKGGNPFPQTIFSLLLAVSLFVSFFPFNFMVCESFPPQRNQLPDVSPME
jgi:hypothetical protein